MIDFSPVRNGGVRLFDFSQPLTIDDLRAGANGLIDTILSMLAEADDAQIAYVPDDPKANDPHAIAGEEHIGWSLAHLVVHTTASAEEGAAHSSVLARGIPYTREPRLRYETPWRQVTTKAQCIQRLEESRRIMMGYLDTWPDEPHLDVYRDVSERFIEKNGPQNCVVAYLHGLMHQDGHLHQFREVLQQARTAARSL